MELYSRSESENLKLFFNYSLVVFLEHDELSWIYSDLVINDPVLSALVFKNYSNIV